MSLPVTKPSVGMSAAASLVTTSDFGEEHKLADGCVGGAPTSRQPRDSRSKQHPANDTKNLPSGAAGGRHVAARLLLRLARAPRQKLFNRGGLGDEGDSDLPRARARMSFQSSVRRRMSVRRGLLPRCAHAPRVQGTTAGAGLGGSRAGGPPGTYAWLRPLGRSLSARLALGVEGVT